MKKISASGYYLQRVNSEKHYRIVVCERSRMYAGILQHGEETQELRLYPWNGVDYCGGRAMPVYRMPPTDLELRASMLFAL